jgi:hypothetical protein
MESFRPPTGGIRVVTKHFSALVTEDAIEVKLGDRIALDWKYEPASVAVQPNPDQPSPRSAVRNRKRGSR